MIRPRMDSIRAPHRDPAPDVVPASEPLIERLLEGLAITVEPFAVCEISSGWRLQLDGAEWVTFHFVLQGDGRLRLGHQVVRAISPYTLAIVPARVPHSIESGRRSRVAPAQPTPSAEHGVPVLTAGPDGDRELRVACGRVQAIYGGAVGLFDLLRESIILDFSESEWMRSIFMHLLEEERAPSTGSAAMVASLMTQCHVLVFRRLATSVHGQLPWLSALADPRLAPAIAAVLDAPGQSHTVDSLAARTYMSRSTFANEFTQRVGRSPMRFVRDVRLRRGAKLLRSTELPIDVVARRVGYASRSRFSSAFRDFFGVSPTPFRKSESAPDAPVAGGGP
ncbi:MAG TPA: AraC family transcriptional regulator [Solirubrobacterales bacterium]